MYSIKLYYAENDQLFRYLEMDNIEAIQLNAAVDEIYFKKAGDTEWHYINPYAEGNTYNGIVFYRNGIEHGYDIAPNWQVQAMYDLLKTV